MNSFGTIKAKANAGAAARVNRASGGKAPKGKSKGKTQVNVIVAPERGASSAAAPGGGAGLSRAPVPPIAPGGLGGLGAGTAPTAPNGVRPGALKKGGKVCRADGGRTYRAGAATGEGRLEKKRAYGE